MEFSARLKATSPHCTLDNLHPNCRGNEASTPKSDCSTRRAVTACRGVCVLAYLPPSQTLHHFSCHFDLILSRSAPSARTVVETNAKPAGQKSQLVEDSRWCIYHQRRIGTCSRNLRPPASETSSGQGLHCTRPSRSPYLPQQGLQMTPYCFFITETP